jgi:putative two-component system response regulator
MNNRAGEMIARAKILIVDDQEQNLRLLRRILENQGCEQIRETTQGSQAVGIVDEFAPDLVLLDLHMPDPDGFEILRLLKNRLSGPRGLAVLILTGDATRDTKRAALSLGARDFLAKPFDSGEALLRIGNLLETRFLYQELELQNAQLEMRVRERTADLAESQVETLERLARASEVRDDETGRHTQRVGELSAAIAWAYGLSDRMVELIRQAAPLHDVGKIGIPDAILLKPSGLSPEELAVMRSHTFNGARILSGGKSELIQMAERIALNHHEQWNGTGYPKGLKGSAIPIEARIVAVADCVDALTHNRPYRPSKPIDMVIDEVKRCSGTQFDPDVVSALIKSGVLRTVVVSPPKPWAAIA